MLLYPHGSESILPQGIQHQVCTRVSYPRVPRVPPTPSSTPCCCIRMEVRVSYLKVYNIRFARVSATHAYLVYRLRLPPHRAAGSERILLHEPLVHGSSLEPQVEPPRTPLNSPITAASENIPLGPHLGPENVDSLLSEWQGCLLAVASVGVSVTSAVAN
ncbi:hypothetical protein J6590_042753 [Homalodisca vitripennis]|nr:hypothetical protein J6590_042753 [Homalodisca vitripennis]